MLCPCPDTAEKKKKKKEEKKKAMKTAIWSGS